VKPIDFVTDIAGGYNDPVGKVAPALTKNIRIFAVDGEYEVLSYYFDEDSKRMMLDIQRKETPKKKGL
jgi:hypothetical protein